MTITLYTSKQHYTSEIDSYRWSWCYIMGQAEKELKYDLLFSNQPKPSEPGLYEAELNGNQVIIKLVMINGKLEGRAIYATDSDYMQYLFNPNLW